MVLFLAIVVVLAMMLYAGSAFAWALIRLGYTAVRLVTALVALLFVMSRRQTRRDGDRTHAA